MVYTRFGSRVKVLSFDHKTGWCGVEIEVKGGLPVGRQVHSSELKADDGLAEIIGEADHHADHEVDWNEYVWDPPDLERIRRNQAEGPGPKGKGNERENK